MYCDWDINKANENVRKHGVSFQEAFTVFEDKLSITYNDPEHSVGENRFLTFGITAKGRFVVVTHTECGDVVRLISSRLMTKHERQKYEEG